MNEREVTFIQEVSKITLSSIITMTVHGETNKYRFSDNPSDVEGFELYVIDNKRPTESVYGLSCGSVMEVVGVLIQDFAIGIISDIKVE